MRKLNARELKVLAKLKRKHRTALDKQKAKMDDGALRSHQCCYAADVSTAHRGVKVEEGLRSEHEGVDQTESHRGYQGT
jgi:hypothetical protein